MHPNLGIKSTWWIQSLASDPLMGKNAFSVELRDSSEQL